MTHPPANSFSRVPVRLNISFDKDTFKFRASSPDVSGWTGEAQTVHGLHHQVSRFLKVTPGALSVELERAAQAAHAGLHKSL